MTYAHTENTTAKYSSPIHVPKTRRYIPKPERDNILGTRSVKEKILIIVMTYRLESHTFPVITYIPTSQKNGLDTLFLISKQKIKRDSKCQHI